MASSISTPAVAVSAARGAPLLDSGAADVGGTVEGDPRESSGAAAAHAAALASLQQTVAERDVRIDQLSRKLKAADDSKNNDRQH